MIERCAAAVADVTARGACWRAPYWSLGRRSLELVEAAGFTYDSSLMADDYRLYAFVAATGIPWRRAPPSDPRGIDRGAGHLGVDDWPRSTCRRRSRLSAPSGPDPRSWSGRAACPTPSRRLRPVVEPQVTGTSINAPSEVRR